jgi:hypothetical protein
VTVQCIDAGDDLISKTIHLDRVENASDSPFMSLCVHKTSQDTTMQEVSCTEG